MALYNLKFNKDDSVIRHILIGLCADLNKKISYFNLVNGNEITISIPFYISLAGDESFMHDYFLLDDLADPEQIKAIGNYEVKPRGVIVFESISIDSGALLNKYVVGKYQKLEPNGTIRSYHAQFQMIPVVMNINTKIIVDTQLEVFKVIEKIIKNLYKNNHYQVDVGTLQQGSYRIPCWYKLPEDYEMERPIEFTFDDQKNRNINFSIELRARIPAFEPKTEIYSGNRMINIEQNIETTSNIDKPPTIGGSDSIFNQTNS